MFLWSEPAMEEPKSPTTEFNTRRQVSKGENVCFPWPHRLSRSQWKEEMDLVYSKPNVCVVRDDKLSRRDSPLLALNSVTNHNKADPTMEDQTSEKNTITRKGSSISWGGVGYVKLFLSQ